MNKKMIMIWMTMLLTVSAIQASIANAVISQGSDKMYLDPLTINYTTATAQVGTKFNVTVWLDVASNVNSWQFYLTYDKALLTVTNSGYSGNGKSLWSGADPTDNPPSSTGSHNATHDYLLYGEVLKASKERTGAGSLAWIEFKIAKAPGQSETLTSELRLDLVGVFSSSAMDKDFNPITLTFGKATYTFAGVAPPPTYTLTITTTLGGTTDPSPGTYSYQSGTPVTVEATADQGYSFDHWELDSENVGSANPITVTMDANHDLRAVFAAIPPPPPSGHLFDVNWSDYSLSPKYPRWGGEHHNGSYPVWKNFTVTYYGENELTYISVRYPETTPNLKPSRYEIRTFPINLKWAINVNLADRLVEFFAGPQGLSKNWYAIVSIEFIQGPTAEDGTPHEFAVTVSEGDPSGQTFYKYETIDKTAPQVEITFPKATTLGGKGYVFVKKPSGDIWVQMPNCTNRNIQWLWINGTANDVGSGINRIEIWINGTYLGDATYIEKTKTWWWRTDPTHPQPPTPRGFWKPECWYYVVARAYDNSVNDEDTVMHGSVKVPKTNSKDTSKNWFFWMTNTTVQLVQDWVPGNGQIDVKGTTGFYPNGDVNIWIENKLYGTKVLLTTVTSDNYGRFYTTINHLPELPRKPTSGERWNVTAVDIKGNAGSDLFTLIPWITYEKTMPQNDATIWQTTKKGKVSDTFNVYGHGFLPSRQTDWDFYSTVYVRVVYTDVAPLEKWEIRQVFNGTSQFNWNNASWYPRLSEVVLAEVATDAKGYWSAQITVPQSYGGLHAIYAYEYRVVTDPYMPGPKTIYDLVKSGWPAITNIGCEEQAVIFDVWPTIAVAPTTAITNQYVTITGEGLPLPKYYKLWKDGTPVVANRDQCFVLDFGPCEQWVFENKRIRNNELDLAWVMETWYPFSYYTPDMAQYLESPVWKGKLTSITMDYAAEKNQFHIGSKFLKVPTLPAGQYSIKVYYFDKNTESYVYDYQAKTSINVLKDPLHVNVEVGRTHFPNEIVKVFTQIDVDGIAVDATTLDLGLYKGETLVQALSYNGIGSGAYVSTFTCPSEIGDYFIKISAAKDYDTFTLYASAIAGFTLSQSMGDINAKLVELEGKIAMLQTDLGQVRIDLSNVNTRVVSIEGKVVTIETNVGSMKADVSTINGKVVNIEGKVVTIQTDVGTLRTDVSAIGGKVTSIQGTVATVSTDVGTVKTTITSIGSVMTGLHDDAATIHTDVGDLEVKLKDLDAMVTISKDVATIQTVLGEVRGRVISLEDTTATIKTDLGTVTTKADSIQGNIGLQPITIGLSLLAALATIIAAVLILRKVYLK